MRRNKLDFWLLLGSCAFIGVAVVVSVSGISKDRPAQDHSYREFTLVVGTEDFFRGSESAPYFIPSEITVSSMNYATSQSSTNPNSPTDSRGGYTRFSAVPTNEVVTVANSASGFESDFDQIYISEYVSDIYDSWLENVGFVDRHGFITVFRRNHENRAATVTVAQDGISCSLLYWKDPAVQNEVQAFVAISNKLVRTDELLRWEHFVSTRDRSREPFSAERFFDSFDEDIEVLNQSELNQLATFSTNNARIAQMSHDMQTTGSPGIKDLILNASLSTAFLMLGLFLGRRTS